MAPAVFVVLDGVADGDRGGGGGARGVMATAVFVILDGVTDPCSFLPGELCQAASGGGGGGKGVASVDPEMLLAKLAVRKSEPLDGQPELLMVLATNGVGSRPSLGTSAFAATAKDVANGGRPLSAGMTAADSASASRCSNQMVRSGARPMLGPAGPVGG